MDVRSTKTTYWLALCGDCGSVLPFGTEKARDEWAAVHATVHDPFTDELHIVFTARQNGRGAVVEPWRVGRPTS